MKLFLFLTSPNNPVDVSVIGLPISNQSLHNFRCLKSFWICLRSDLENDTLCNFLVYGSHKPYPIVGLQLQFIILPFLYLEDTVGFEPTTYRVLETPALTTELRILLIHISNFSGGVGS
jgi:hypothetical protein